MARLCSVRAGRTVQAKDCPMKACKVKKHLDDRCFSRTVRAKKSEILACPDGK